VRLRTWIVAGIVIVVVAAVAGLVASPHPDGLQHVAERAGFADQGRTGTPALDGWLGRVAGSLAVLLGAAALFHLLRPRGRVDDDAPDPVDRGRR
jgi:hypothetical protein